MPRNWRAGASGSAIWSSLPLRTPAGGANGELTPSSPEDTAGEQLRLRTRPESAPLLPRPPRRPGDAPRADPGPRLCWRLRCRRAPGVDAGDFMLRLRRGKPGPRGALPAPAPPAASGGWPAAGLARAAAAGVGAPSRRHLAPTPIGEPLDAARARPPAPTFARTERAADRRCTRETVPRRVSELEDMDLQRRSSSVLTKVTHSWSSITSQTPSQARMTNSSWLGSHDSTRTSGCGAN